MRAKVSRDSPSNRSARRVSSTGRTCTGSFATERSARRAKVLKEAKSSSSLGRRSRVSVVRQFRVMAARAKPACASSSPSRARVSASREKTSTVRRSTRRSPCATPTKASTAAGHSGRGTASPKRSTRRRRRPGTAQLAASSMANAPTQRPSCARRTTHSDSTPRRASAHPARWGRGNRIPARARSCSHASRSADPSRSSVMVETRSATGLHHTAVCPRRSRR